MSDLNKDQLQRLARLGAQARLDELRHEEAVIRAAFPDLFGRGRGRKPGAAAAAQPASRRRRRGMSAANRRAVSERMKKYWAARRKAKAK